MQSTVAEHIAAALRQTDVAHAFGLIGEGNMHLANAFTAAGISFIASRHESAAIGMADGYARASGTFGVASVTQGPGVTNALTALVTAMRGRTPLLFFAPEIPPEVRWHIQSLDVAKLARSLGLSCSPLDLSSPEEFVLDAVRWISRNRQPLVVRFPYPALELPTAARTASSALPPDLTTSKLSAPSVAEVAEVVGRSQRPLFIAGAGARDAAPMIAALAERAGGALATTLLAKGMFAGHPRDLGVCGGFSIEGTRRAVQQSDCIVAFGASLNYYTNHQLRLFPSSAVVVQCDTNEEAIGRVTPVDIGVVGDAREFASALLGELQLHSVVAKRPTAEADVEAAADVPEGERRGRGEGETGIDPRALLHGLNQMLPQQRLVVAEGGHHMGFVARHLDANGTRGFIMPIDFGSIGMALGVAIGAAHAVLDKCVVLTVGDGSLLMSLSELESLARHQVRCAVVVLDDACYGAEYHVLDMESRDVGHSVYAHQDFAALARAVNIPAVTIRNGDDLTAVPAFLDENASGPVLIDCKVDRSVRGDWLTSH